MVERKLPARLHNHVFCPGCGHGILVRILYEVFEELGVEKNNCLVCGVGCSCSVRKASDNERVQTAHGRAASVATGMKRYKPGMVVVTYQGDGDAGVIGLAETLNAAYRNENITVITVNNTTFGMTGGQMSWTTMPGQVTTTSVHGRDCSKTGAPIHLPEIIAHDFKVAYVARGAIYDVPSINKTKKMLKNAIEAQINGEGYSMVEVLCSCPTNWGLSPLKAVERLKTEVMAEYPVGEFITRRTAE